MILLNSQSNIPDWIQAAGVILGVPTAIWGIFKLFRKNKEFERKIDVLDSIVQNQEILNNKFKEQVEELKIQTETLSVRNELANESNQYLKELINIQNKALLSDKEHKERYMEALEKERKSKIKPYFTNAGGHGNRKKYLFKLQNIGEKAIMQKPNDQNTSKIFVRFNFKNNQPIEKNRGISFEIESRGKIDLNIIEATIIIPFSNADNDNYIQKIKIKSLGISVSKPEEK